MSVFKNTVTGNVTTVFGPIHDNFALRADEELIHDDRDALNPPVDTSEPVVPIAADGGEVVADSGSTDSSGDVPAVSQETTTSDASRVGNPKE
jgi:hypothetical protein